MKPFDNVSRNGNEKAIRRGRMVPNGDVNLAYIKAPELSPEKNVVVVDTSRIVEENVRNVAKGCKVYYANELGILVDGNDNAVVPDEFPAVTDVFSKEDDAKNFTDHDILPFRHISRHLHLDVTGLTFGAEETDYNSEHIKIVDNRGIEYPNYKVRIAPAFLPDATPTVAEAGDSWGYRVIVYVDTDDNETLYLRYNKVELTEDGELDNRQREYKELLNPEPYFEYLPEESDVVDVTNYKNKVYSTKPISEKDRMLGRPTNIIDGYKVYVPKKAVGDPRIYQAFRWRVKCTFHQDSVVDPSTDATILKCGVLVTNKDLGRSTPSLAPYALLNLSRSRFNVGGVNFQNPKKNSHSSTEKNKRDYWFVNLDEDDLSEYDFLIWAPTGRSEDFKKYAGKVSDFISAKGGTLFLDSGRIADLDDNLGGQVSSPAHPWIAGATMGSSGAPVQSVSHKDFRFRNSDHALLDGNTQLSGWTIDKDILQIDSMSYITFKDPDEAYTHGFITKPSGYTTLIDGKKYGASGYAPTVVAKKFSRGTKILSTIGILDTCSRIFDPADGSLVHSNFGTSVATNVDYGSAINGAAIEGAMKFLYNAALLAVRNKSVDNSDETAYSTTWSAYTPWKGSWVIDGDVLDRNERNEHSFSLEYKDELSGDLETVYKRKLSNKSMKSLIEEANADMFENDVVKQRLESLDKTYEIEVTNELVDVPSAFNENDIPTAWTEAHSPAFIVPPEIGPHVIRQERSEDGKTGRAIQFEDATYSDTQYPDQPYGGRITNTYVASEELADTNKVTVTLTGTYTGWKNVRVVTQEASTTSTTSNIELSWRDARVQGVSGAGDSITPGSQYYTNTSFPEYGMVKPHGLITWQDVNYYTSGWGPGHRCWPYYGIDERLVVGSSGDLVRFVQDAMNRFAAAKFFGPSTGTLKVDGHYGSKTSQAVRDFQTTLQAIYVDGVIDAETWYLIATQINRMATLGISFPNTRTGYQKWYRQADRIRFDRISDGDNTFWMKRSWVKNGPSQIWDLFAITFDQSYKWHSLSITPFLHGSTNTMMVRSIHVTNERSLVNYDSRNGQLTYMNHRPRHGQKLTIPFGPYTGDTIIVGVGQDGPSGIGSSRFIGLEDITAHTNVTTVTYQPEVSTIEEQPEEDQTFTVTKTVTVESFKDNNFTVNPPKSISDGYERVSDISFNSMSIDNPDVTGTFTTSGRVSLQSQAVVSDVSGEQTTKGAALGTGHYAMSTNKVLNPVKENGWVSKDDGIKLLCTKDKKPYGFPDLPTGVGDDEAQRHYVKLTLSTDGAGKDVYMSFYDVRQQEFVTTPDGKAEISYIEYINRGPHNIYVAVVSDFEIVRNVIVPDDKDAPRLPFKWAMPVYGVCTNAGSKITLQPLPPRLGATDVWPVSVRPGRFSRRVDIRSRSEGRLTGYLSGYQGMKLEAFYDIPESRLGGFSTRFGAPNYDVTNEEPIIIDDNVLQVRQGPILMATFPTKHPTIADPVRPVVTLYKRDSRQDPWVEQPGNEIADVNASTGEIYLKTPLASSDSGLLRVDYTSKRRNYYFKKHDNTYLNLNAYSGYGQDLVGESLYIYIVPHYVKDPNGNVIDGSYQERTLRMTTSPDIFDYLSPDYDPLAVQLGVVYQSTALDINNVSVLDTRRRGGGARDSANAQELERLVSNASTYWDIGYNAGFSYQKSGFVIIRLPRELEDDFSKAEIEEVIKRNLTAGVGYKVEDLEGREW